MVRYLGEVGGATVDEIAAALELPRAVVRETLMPLAPPPVGIGDVVVLDGDRYALAPPRPPASEPEPEPEPCRMRLDGKHGALRVSHTGKHVCGYCSEPVDG